MCTDAAHVTAYMAGGLRSGDFCRHRDRLNREEWLKFDKFSYNIPDPDGNTETDIATTPADGVSIKKGRQLPFHMAKGTDILFFVIVGQDYVCETSWM